MSGFMGAIIGKAERVSTVHADVLGEAASSGEVLDEVARDDANRRVTDQSRRFGLCDSRLQERMPAEARILFVTISSRHVMHTMAEDAAQISHLLPECHGLGIWVMTFAKEQRVTALHADVFMAAVAIGQLLVMVLAEETRQGVPDVRDRAVFGQVARAAAAPPAIGVRCLEDVVVDVMSPHGARESSQ
jgi:hypothetical protein